MAEQKMTVKLDPGQVEGLKQFVRDQIRLALREEARQEVRMPAQALSPIRIQAPDGVRLLFVDSVGESHWVKPGGFVAAQSAGWRQAFVKGRA